MGRNGHRLHSRSCRQKTTRSPPACVRVRVCVCVIAIELPTDSIHPMAPICKYIFFISDIIYTNIILSTHYFTNIFVQ